MAFRVTSGSTNKLLPMALGVSVNRSDGFTAPHVADDSTAARTYSFACTMCRHACLCMHPGNMQCHTMAILGAEASSIFGFCFFLKFNCFPVTAPRLSIRRARARVRKSLPHRGQLKGGSADTGLQCQQCEVPP